MALPRDPGSTANTAYDFENLSGTENVTEFIGSTDTTDIYKFSLTETSDFSLNLNNYDGVLGAYLYIDSNEDGQINDGERLYGNSSSRGVRINSTLGAADYFVSVSRQSDSTNTNYNLSLSAPVNPPSIDTDPGSSGDTAYAIGNLNGTQSVTEFIGATDTRDIYKFSLTETSDFSLNLNNYDGVLGAYLYIDSNEDGQINDVERLYGTSSSRAVRINSTLGAADYFVSVSRQSDSTNTNYNLSLSAPANPPSINTDPGSSGDTAYELRYINLDTSEDNRKITEFTGTTDTKDVYKFSLLQNSDFSLNLNNYDGVLGAYLYIDSNEDGQINDGERLYGTSSSRAVRINSTLGAADYFVSVSRQSDSTNTNYDLDLKFVADPLSTISVIAQDAEAKEEGTNAGKFRITRDGDTSEPYTVNYDITTGGGQATNGVDYEELSGSVTIPAEQIYVDLFVTPIDDDVVERNEEVTITLREVDGDLGTGTSQTATVTIEDNDVIPTFTIEAADNEAKEEEEEVGKFRIRHDVNTNKPQTVKYRIATGNNQATNGEDYAELSGSVTIPEGQDFVELTIEPKEDFLVEGTERVTITVEDVDGNPGTQDNQTATINLLDNDRHPNFTIEATDSEALEEGAETASFRISHDGTTAIDHTVNYQIASGDNQAINGEDYAELSGSVTIPEGKSFVNLTITPTDDEAVETEEQVTITLKDVDGNLGTEENQTASITIEDNDIDPKENSIELFRFRNTTFETGTYVFVGEAERDFILEDENLSRTFALDGVAEDGTINSAFMASAVDGDNLIPFYRLESLILPGTFLFVSTAEYDFIFDDPIQKEQWRKQGFAEGSTTEDIPEFYLSDGSASNGIEFSRFQNTQNGTFLYAGSAETDVIVNNESLSNLFAYQGTAFKSLVF